LEFEFILDYSCFIPGKNCKHIGCYFARFALNIQVSLEELRSQLRDDPLAAVQSMKGTVFAVSAT